MNGVQNGYQSQALRSWGGGLCAFLLGDVFYELRECQKVRELCAWSLLGTNSRLGLSLARRIFKTELVMHPRCGVDGLWWWALKWRRGTTKNPVPFLSTMIWTIQTNGCQAYHGYMKALYK